MNAFVASLAKRALLGCRHYHRHLRADTFPGVAVLCYHAVVADVIPFRGMPFADLHVRVSELEAHCRIVRSTCQPISLQTWRESLAGGPALPSRPVLFTFDDGYRSAFTLARPVLEQYGIPAVLFASTGWIQRRSLTWYDAVGRERGDAEVERLKRVGFGEWKRVTEALMTPAGSDDPAAPLTPSEIRIWADVPGFEVGSHTVDHPILAMANAAEQRRQILESKALLEAWTGRPVLAFAYPNGQPKLDYTKQTVGIVREAGFDFAFTTVPRFAMPGEPPLERSRYVMLASISAAELAHRLSHSWRNGARTSGPRRKGLRDRSPELPAPHGQDRPHQ